jgi:hypothetical protein
MAHADANAVAGISFVVDADQHVPEGIHLRVQLYDY